ncbi:MAG TPA: hypothetical protein VF834_03205 [Streptosporangiaceae bacterium]
MKVRIGRIALAAIGTTTLTAFMTLGAGIAANASSTHNSPKKIAMTTHFKKSNFRTPVGPASRVGQVTPDVTGSNGQMNGYSYITITPHNGSSGGFNMGFSSSYVSGCDFWSCWRNVNSGNSYTNWLGSSPYDASSMGLTDNIWVGGVAISVSIGSGGGFGISVSNSTVTLSSSYGPTWQIAHNYYNVDFSTHVAIWGPYQNANASASFTWQTFYNNIN